MVTYAELEDGLVAWPATGNPRHFGGGVFNRNGGRAHCPKFGRN
jgi:hypothetical protein